MKYERGHSTNVRHVWKSHTVVECPFSLLSQCSLCGALGASCFPGLWKPNLWSIVGWIFWRPSDLGGAFYTNLLRGLHAKPCVVWAAYLFFSEFLGNQICDPASAGFFEGRQIWEVRFERTCSKGFMRSLAWFGPHICFLAQSLKTKSVIQRWLFLKVVRCGRCVLHELVSRVSCEALHSLASEIPVNQIRDPASAGIFEGRQI